MKRMPQVGGMNHLPHSTDSREQPSDPLSLDTKLLARKPVFTPHPVSFLIDISATKSNQFCNSPITSLSCAALCTQIIQILYI